MSILPTLISSALLVACAPHTPPTAAPAEAPVTSPPTESPLNADAITGVTDPMLQRLLSEHWDWTMAENPVWATRLGDRRFDERVPDRSPGAQDAALAKLAELLGRAKGIDPSGLDSADRNTLELFTEHLARSLDTAQCRFWTWSLSARHNPLVEWGGLPEMHPHDTPEELASLRIRYGAIPASIDTAASNLGIGAAEGRRANAESVRRVIEMFDRELARPASEWRLSAPDDPEIRRLVAEEIAPALKRYRDVLESDILPGARAGADVGLTGIAEGDACYAAVVKEYTTLDRSPDVIHQAGLDALEGIHAEMIELGDRLFGTRDRAAIAERLRTDPELMFETPEEIEQVAERALSNARAAIPEHFGVLPQAECVVVPIRPDEAPYTTIAYYRPTADDEPGEYFVNTHAPTTRPRFEAEVLAFHESIPGHHLQIAIARELPAMPAFRQYMGMTAFVEGWALYTERLADEMGLYSGDLDRMGMLSFDAWRAARLVVDTGIHARGWSREEAVRFMVENTVLAENNIDNEVDRYISWPGQALAYKTGQIEIARMRAEAEAALGEDFDLKGFHDVVLTGGAVTLSVLERQVDEWSRQQP